MAETSLAPSKVGTLVLDFQTPEKGMSGKVQSEQDPESCEKRRRSKRRAGSRGQEGKE